MSRRSLQASAAGIDKARRVFKQRLLTQEELASEVGIETRQPIWKFFAGKPIERHIFMEICFQLDLDWQEITSTKPEILSQSPEQVSSSLQDLDALVQTVRVARYDKIQAQCGTVRFLDIAQLIDLNDIYVNISVIEALPSQNWIDVAALSGETQESEGFSLHQVPRISSKKALAIDAVAIHPKLMLLGKPGSGKTLFLQHIAIQCNQGQLFPKQIPILIRLKNLLVNVNKSEQLNLLSYLRQEILNSNISESQVETLLRHGKVLILLDGLDELSTGNKNKILNQIQYLAEEYYANQLIVTHRTTSGLCWLEGFFYVEVADFDLSQVEAFAQNWFVNVERNSYRQGLNKTTQFMHKLRLAENRRLRELVRTPLLNSLICSGFQTAFNFSAKHSDFCKQALDILLVRWDEARGINRNEAADHLPLAAKLKLLSQIAVTTFERGDYFFAQDEVQQHIANYLQTSSAAKVDPEVLQINSKAVLNSIEAQHGLLVGRARGIYSFSHLAFQEYLAARYFAVSSNSQNLSNRLNQLIKHVTEPRWREFILLAVETSNNNDDLLQMMQQRINSLLTADEMLQQFLVWIAQKSTSIQSSYQAAAIRAFYLTLAFPRNLFWYRDLSLALAIDGRLAGNVSPDLNIDLNLNRALILSLDLCCHPTLDKVFALNFALPNGRKLTHQAELQHNKNELLLLGESLQQLKKQLPSLSQDREQLTQWWTTNGQTWTEIYRSLLLRYRNIGHIWQFSTQQQQMLQQYYIANLFLVSCLNSRYRLTSAVRQKIEETLLLPDMAALDYS